MSHPPETTHRRPRPLSWLRARDLSADDPGRRWLHVNSTDEHDLAARRDRMRPRSSSGSSVAWHGEASRLVMRRLCAGEGLLHWMEQHAAGGAEMADVDEPRPADAHAAAPRLV